MRSTEIGKSEFNGNRVVDISRDSQLSSEGNHISGINTSIQPHTTKGLNGISRESVETIEFDIRVLQPNLPNGVAGKLKVSPQAFRPDDEWASEFREGLRKADLSKVVIEIGVGTGANIVVSLAFHPRITKIHSSDYDATVAQLAADNVLSIKGIDKSKFCPILGQSDLLDGFRRVEGERAPLDVVIACIPQVRLPADGSSRLDQLAHYYSGPVPEGFEEFDHYDMTLNARLLMQAGQHLEPGSGRVILNLAGRVPMAVLQKMFSQAGFSEVKVVHEAIIHQHSGTRLYDFIKQEEELGISFEFFACPECGGERITAKQAQALIDEGLPAFHKLYVIEGTYLGLQ